MLAGLGYQDRKVLKKLKRVEDQIEGVKFEFFRVPMAYANAFPQMVVRTEPHIKNRPHPQMLFSYQRDIFDEETQKSKPSFEPFPRGGHCTCTITLKNGKTIHGESTCSLNDNYNFTLSRKISFGRAMAILVS